MHEVSERGEQMKRIGILKEKNGVVFIKFEKAKKNHSRRYEKEAAMGILLCILITAIFMGIAEVNARGADTELPQEYVRYCEEIGQIYNICPELLEAVIEAESNGNPDAIGELGELGLMQIYPKYHRVRAEHLRVYNLFNPRGNILVGADYLEELFEVHKDMGTVLMIYNGTKDAAERGRRGDYTDYARKIMKRCEQLERLHIK